ncbi:MAG: hypothetical protein A2X94_10210 [Bdellovibrionales bacterium GWB1_55_8]|nr:MAG: hypothetical protein A2X94_10210 [Bdellovibrionales bacterium GWB1_55_8]
MVKTLRLVRLVLITLVFCSSSVVQAVGITPVSGLNITGGTFNYGTHTTGSNFGGGVLADTVLADSVQFESGLIYLPHKIISHQNLTTNSYWTGLQIPVIARYAVLPFLHAGGGVYYEYVIGNFEYVNSERSENTIPPRDANIGLIANVQSRFPVSAALEFVADARFEWGLLNFEEPDSPLVTKYNHFVVLTGFRFTL